jgi:hypothetical protein
MQQEAFSDGNVERCVPQRDVGLRYDLHGPDTFCVEGFRPFVKEKRKVDV